MNKSSRITKHIVPDVVALICMLAQHYGYHSSWKWSALVGITVGAGIALYVRYLTKSAEKQANQAAQ